MIGLILADQNAGYAWMTAYPSLTFSDSALGVESRHRKKVVEEWPTARELDGSSTLHRLSGEKCP